MTRQRDLEFSDVVRARWPMLHEAILQVGHRQTRNRGTIGGSLCHLDPSAELVSLRRGARCHRDGRRAERPARRSRSRISRSPIMTPAIELNEMLTAIRFPHWPAGPRLRLRRVLAPARRFRHRVGGGAAGGRRRRQDHARLGHARRHGHGAGARARGRAGDHRPGAGRRSVRASACESCRKFEAIDDVHAPASYRQHLATVLSRRALEKAYARLRGTEPRHAAH